MSFEPPAGILDIGNATLRVGKLEVAETSGLNQGLQNIVKNDLLITETAEYTTNQTWGLKLPTAWVADFDIKGGTGKYVEFNFYNEGSTSNAQGYTLHFEDTSLTLKYDNGSTLASATIPTIVGTYRKVNIFFERNVVAVSIDGTRYLYDKRPSVLSRVISTTGSAFLNTFFESDHGGNSGFKNLRIVNGRFISDKTSNVSFIGSLGVGVNSPKEALDIRGNMHFNRVSNVSQIKVDSNVVTEYTGPHDRPLREYPEIAMTTTSETSSGYKGYKVSTSSQLTNYEGYRAFDKTGWETPASENNNAWVSGGSKYVAATGAPDTGAATTSYVGGTATGEYVQLQLPRKIKISKYDYTPRTHTGNDEGKGAPKTVKLLGSNNGSTWTLIKDITHLGTRPEEGVFYTAQVGATEYYDYIRFVATSTYSDGTSPTFTDVRLSQIRFYGHEEGSGSLDTTLKSVYNVPATTGTQLEVYYDGQDYSGVTSTVTDKVGTTTNATISNSGSTITFDSTYKAWTFGGSSGRTDTFRSSSLPSTFTGNQVHSITLWFNMSNISDGSIFVITPSGGENGGDVIMGQTQGDGARISYSFWGNDVSFDLPTNLATGSWYHLSMTYDATDNSTGRKMFLNGIECTAINTASGSLSLPNSNMIISFANRVSQTTYPFFGSIANFRLYSKALNADQVKELYDYQKDYFLGSKSQVTLYKGHLGVGVTEPSGQLELAGDERIQEYPPRAMTDYSNHIEGHGVFCVSASSYYNATQHLPWQAFTPAATSGVADGWNSGDNSTGTNLGYYAETSSGEATSAAALFEGTRGEWVQLKCPYPIIVKKFEITGRSNGVYVGSPEDQPGSGILYGSNDGNNWDVLVNFSGLTYGGASGGSGATGGTENVEVNATKGYIYLVLQATSRVTNYGTDDWINIGRLRYFGTPGPTTLDKGSLSLGKSISSISMIKGSDYEVPMVESLRVYLNTDSDPRSGSSKGVSIGGRNSNKHVFNIAYTHNHAILGGNVIWEANKQAIYFNGSTGGTPEVAYASDLGFSGDQEHSVSLWFWSNDAQSTFGNNEHALYGTGNVNGGTQTGLSLYNTYAQVWRNGGGTTYDISFNENEWNHLCMTYSGGGSVNSRLWLNGVELTQNGAVTSTSAYSFNAADFLVLGDWINNSGDIQESYPWRGYMSNFKLWNAVLTDDQVLAEYKRGRVAKKSLVMSDVYLGVGCEPRCHLDVMGNARVSGGLMIDRGLIVHQTYQGTNHITVCGRTYKRTNPGVADSVAFLRGTFARTYGVGVIHVYGSIRTNSSGLQNNFHYMIGLQAIPGNGIVRYDTDNIVGTGYMSTPNVYSEPGGQDNNDGFAVKTIHFEFNTNGALGANGTYCVWTAHCEFSNEFSVTPISDW